MAQCGYCKGEIVGGNRNTKYCSIKCRKKEAVRLRDERGIVWRSSKICKCALCGIEFRPKLNGGKIGKYCTRECYFKSNCGRPKKERVGGYRVGRHTRINIISCVECGGLFISKWKNKTLCSRKCSIARNAQTAAYKHRGKVYGISVKCKECGEDFKIVFGSGNRIFCSRKCIKKYNHRVAKCKRGARIRGATVYESVDPRRILRRDKWTCQLCGVQTPARLRGTNEQCAPEVDHVIPLAGGGEHTYHNLQCLCRRCNGIKSDRLVGQIKLPMLTGTYGGR